MKLSADRKMKMKSAANGFQNENNAANLENENNFDIIKIGNIPSLTSEMKNWKIKIFLDGAIKKC